jgi:hypothetical protein
MFTGPHAEEPIFRKPATQARLPSEAFGVVRRHRPKPREIRKIVLTFFRGVYRTRDV